MFGINGVLDGEANASHDGGMKVGSGSLLAFKTALKKVVVGYNDAGGVASISRRGGKVGSWADTTLLGLVFGSNIPINVASDQVESTERIQGSELHLSDVVEFLKPGGISNTSEGRYVESGLREKFNWLSHNGREGEWSWM